MAQQPGLMERLLDSMCLHSLLGFVFNKGVRRGPRVLLNLAAVLMALIIVVKLLPSHMTQTALQSIPIPQSVWSSLTNGNDDSVPGGLRIVVFGEIDIGTPVAPDDEMAESKTWTEALCEKLSCDRHISMVPSPDAASWSVSSNELYAQGIEKVFNETMESEAPGQDYSYLATHFPTQWKSADLRQQVDKFLAMPKPQNAPGATLWIFSFGLWDIWALSALPLASAKDYTSAMTKDIFEQIERLHAASMDPKSIAFSDIKTFMKNRERAAERTADGADDQVEERDESVAAQPTEEAAAEESPKPNDTFQILIPRVLDPSLLPGWRDLRPLLPAVHSKAEQQRNAAALTTAWNDGISAAWTEWMKKDDTVEDKGDDTRGEDEALAPPLVTAPTSPLRDGFAYNLADFVIEQMLERQMRSAHLEDGAGRGAGGVEDGYRDVRNACLQPVSTVAVAVSVQSDVTLNIPNIKIESDRQMPAHPVPTIDTTAPPPAVARRIEEDDDDDEEEIARRYEAKKAIAYMDTARPCEIPGDHLFYTPFALSQKAIQQATAEMADMVRNNESVRAKLAGGK